MRQKIAHSHLQCPESNLLARIDSSAISANVKSSNPPSNSLLYKHFRFSFSLSLSCFISFLQFSLICPNSDLNQFSLSFPHEKKHSFSLPSLLFLQYFSPSMLVTNWANWRPMGPIPRFAPAEPNGPIPRYDHNWLAAKKQLTRLSDTTLPPPADQNQSSPRAHSTDGTLIAPEHGPNGWIPTVVCV